MDINEDEMASVFATLQVVAFLFTANNTVAVSAEDVPPERAFVVPNSEEGVFDLGAQLGGLLDRSRSQLLCVGVAPGARLEGPIAEELTHMPVRRFLLAQSKLYLFAKSENLDPYGVESVILACRDMYPKR
jgi:hypothetical protein